MLNSAEISGMIGQQQMMFAQQQAFSQQIGAGFAMAPPNFGLMGGFGAPGRAGEMATERLANAGLQPIFGAMQGAGSMMGMTGTALGTFGGPAGMVAGIGLQAGGALLGATAGAMGQGAYQQMFLNDTMRQNYNFMGAGRQGFDRQDTRQIGSVMSSMSHQTGPMGEHSSVEELTRVAGKLGQMGMMNGVRDVQQFTARFKETINTLKTMAQDLGTTLEGALEFSKAQQSSGFFQNADKLRATQLARQMALSGNMSITEMTAAGQIGSQIARSMGGLGKQGAIGGMRALGTVGTATQIGTLSDEDIYNATGLDGAEGRQAMATRMMQVDAQFYRSSKGRRMLASMADKDGKLDQDAVQKIMNGDMTVGETMSEDGKHLGNVGRANFIRNEGKLRSAAMEQFAGLGAAVQMREWAQGKGIDIYDEKDDRAAIWAGRQFGTSEDETAAIMKMARDLPQILQEQKRVKKVDARMKEQAERRSNQGLAGVKKRLSESIDGLKQDIADSGRAVLNQASDWLDDTINSLTGVTPEAQMSERAAKIADVYGGGAASKSLLLGGSSKDQQGMRRFLGGGATTTNTDKGVSRAALLKAAWGGDTKALESEVANDKANDKTNAMRRIHNAALTSDFDKDFEAYGKKQGDMLSDRYRDGQLEGEGEERLRNFGMLIKDKKLKERFDKASPEEKARMMASTENGLGDKITDKHKLGNHTEIPRGADKVWSESERKERMASAFGLSGPSLARAGMYTVDPIFAAIGGLFNGDNKKFQEQEAYLGTDKAKQQMADLASDDEEKYKKAQQDLVADMDAGTGPKELQNKMLQASRYGHAKTQEERDEIIRSSKMSKEELEKAAAGLGAVAQQKYASDKQAYMKQAAGEAQKSLDVLKKGGAITIDKDGKVVVSKDVKAALKNVPGGEEIFQKAAQIEHDQAAVGDDEGKQRGIFDRREEVLQAASKLTVEQQQQLAKKMRAEGSDSAADAIETNASNTAALKKAGGGTKGIAEAMRQMGITVKGADGQQRAMSIEDLKRFDVDTDKGLQAFLRDNKIEGVTDSQQKEIKAAAAAAKAGRTAEAEEHIRKVQSSGGVDKAKGKDEGKKGTDPDKDTKGGADKSSEKVVAGINDMKGAIVGKLGEVVAAVGKSNAEKPKP